MGFRSDEGVRDVLEVNKTNTGRGGGDGFLSCSTTTAAAAAALL